MKNKFYDQIDKKDYDFTTYFVINNGAVFETDNYNFENNLEDCFYIKKISSNGQSKIYLDAKKNNVWIYKNQLVGNCCDFASFIAVNHNSCICIRGFSHSDIEHFITLTNKLSGINIRFIRFNNNSSLAKYERHIFDKQRKMKELREKIDENGEIKSTKQYLTIANSIINKDRHNSRIKIIQLKKSK